MSNNSHELPPYAVRWCFHATAMVTDYEASRDTLGRLFGLVPLEDNSETDPAVGRRGGMAWVGDNSIEIGEPIVDDGAVDRFIKRFGPGHHSFGVQVANLDAAIAHVEALGVTIAARPMPFFCFADPRTTDGLLLEWADGELDIDPRFGAEIPAYDGRPLIEVDQMAFVGVSAIDPAATATRLAELFGTSVTFSKPDAPLGMPQAGVSIGDLTVAVCATDDRPRVQSMGLRCVDIESAAANLEAEGIAFEQVATALVLDPGGTGDVPITLVAELLPGDPRSTSTRGDGPGA